MLQDLSPEQQFLAVSAALAEVENASTRAALAQDVFGRAGTTLLPLVAEGAAGLAELRQQARDLGNTFTTEAAAKAAEFADTLNELKQTIGGLGREIGEKVVPVLGRLLDWFIESRPQIEAFIDPGQGEGWAIRRGLCVRRRLHHRGPGQSAGLDRVQQARAPGRSSAPLASPS